MIRLVLMVIIIWREKEFRLFLSADSTDRSLRAVQSTATPPAALTVQISFVFPTGSTASNCFPSVHIQNCFYFVDVRDSL